MTPLIHITSYMLSSFHSIVFSHLKLASMKTDNRLTICNFHAKVIAVNSTNSAHERCTIRSLCAARQRFDISAHKDEDQNELWKCFEFLKLDDVLLRKHSKVFSLILTLTTFYSFIHHQQHCPADFAEIPYVLMTVRCIKSSMQSPFLPNKICFNQIMLWINDDKATPETCIHVHMLFWRVFYSLCDFIKNFVLICIYCVHLVK